MLHVVYQPMDDLVARLDASGTEWVLHLDAGSPPEDHCWAMTDVLRIVLLGVDAAGSARPVSRPRLRLVRD
jgi:hypothetical protein